MTPRHTALVSRTAPLYRDARELIHEARIIRRQVGNGAFYEAQAEGLLEAVSIIRGEIRKARKAAWS